MTRRLHVQGRMPSTTPLDHGSRIPSRVIRMPIGSANSTQSRRATPRYVTSLSVGRRSCHPRSWQCHPSPKRPSPSDIQELAGKGRLHTTDDDIVLLVRNPTLPPTSSDKPNSVGRAACLLNDEPVRIYVPLFMRPWIIQACHSTASCHLAPCARYPCWSVFIVVLA